MKLELKHVAPLRAGNVIGALYFVMSGCFSLVFLAFSGSIQPDPNLPPEQQEFFRSALSWMLVAYPFLGAGFGWLFGLFGAVLYNVLSPWLGGFRVDVAQEPAA